MLPVLGLALGSSLAWGLSDFLGGIKSRSLPLLTVLLVSQGTALSLLVGIVVALGGRPPAGAFGLYASLGGLGEAIGVAALYRGLAGGVMSIVSAVAASGPVIPVIVGVALGESPSPVQDVGIALVVAGTIVVAYRPGTEADVHRRAAWSVAAGLITAVGFGGFTWAWTRRARVASPGHCWSPG